MTDSPENAERLADQVPAIVSLLVLGVALTALFLGYDWFWMVFVIGYAVVLPVLTILSQSLFGRKDKSDWREDDSEQDEQQDALDTLRERYASGEIDEREFERRVDLLLENETLEDVESRKGRETRSERECN